MKVSLNLVYSGSDVKDREVLPLLLTKSNGDHFQVINFSKNDAIETKEDLDIGSLSQGDNVICSVLGIPSKTLVLSYDVMMRSKSHVYNITTKQNQTATVTLQFQPTLDEKFEKAIAFLEDYSIPWFLKSSQLYITTKKTITGITVDDKTKVSIENFTTYLKDSSMTLIKAVKPMLTEDDVKSFIVQVDELLLKYLTFFDACVDQTKLNIASLLRTFKNAILEHAEKFQIVATKKLESAKETCQVAKVQIQTTVHQSMNTSAETTQLGIHTIQPYTHQIVSASKPLFALAIQSLTNFKTGLERVVKNQSMVVTHFVDLILKTSIQTVGAIKRVCFERKLPSIVI